MEPYLRQQTPIRAAVPLIIITAAAAVVMVMVIKDVHSFFQEESMKIKTNQPILPQTAITENDCTCFSTGPNMLRWTLEEFEVCNLPSTKFLWALYAT
jgi:hypothetical protein